MIPWLWQWIIHKRVLSSTASAGWAQCSFLKCTCGSWLQHLLLAGALLWLWTVQINLVNEWNCGQVTNMAGKGKKSCLHLHGLQRAWVCCPTHTWERGVVKTFPSHHCGHVWSCYVVSNKLLCSFCHVFEPQTLKIKPHFKMIDLNWDFQKLTSDFGTGVLWNCWGLPSLGHL